MAKQNKSTKYNLQGSSIETNSFAKGMSKDIYKGVVPKTMWGHARNAANNSVDGDIGIIGNEPANLECGRVPYTVIGTIHKQGDHWIIYSTDDISSEIGLFDDSKCEYKTLVNDPCLSFNRQFLITGAAKENYDCTWQVYWDDGLNPSRTLNLDDIPYIQVVTSPPNDPCVIYEDTDKLDCEKIRLAPLLDIPCIDLSKSTDGGQLRNGSYQAYIAYTLNDQKVTDYIGVSQIQSLFAHESNDGGLDVKVSNLDKEFEEYELVILSDNQGQKVAKKIGTYSTEQTDINIDFIDPALVSVPLNLLFQRSPAYEKSESMYVVNDYLIRQGPTEQFDFNYQPLANEIKTRWVVAEYNADYYYKGGNKTQFMRDEQYAFFIRWIYNTGERSSSYHIPGRDPDPSSQNQYSQNITPNPGDLGQNSGVNVISNSGLEYNFQVYNTASVTQAGLNIPTGDGGTVIAKGKMGYWQSTEKYPATKPEIWADLCGKHIRHHKMPTEELHESLHLCANDGSTIRLLGVEFDNIARPVDNDGNVITNIIGYEILRGSREGAKSILAKGIYRNMRAYKVPEGDQGMLGESINETILYPNFPYNSLHGDVYHWFDSAALGISGDGNIGGALTQAFIADPFPRTDGCDDFMDSITDYPPLRLTKRDFFTFHSPELMFKRPFLNAYETRIYGAYGGISEGHFIKSELHPQNKLLRNSGAIIGGILGIGYAIGQMQGKKERNYTKASTQTIPFDPYYIQAGASNGSNMPVPPVSLFPVSPVWVGTTATMTANNPGTTAANQIMDTVGGVGELITGGALSNAFINTLGSIEANLNLQPGFSEGQDNYTYKKEDDAAQLPAPMQLVMGAIYAREKMADGAQIVIDSLYNMVSAEDFAYKHNSHGFYSDYFRGNVGDVFRVRNTASNYLGSSFQIFGENHLGNPSHKINNLFRPDTVAIQTLSPSQGGAYLPYPSSMGAPIDKSLYVIGGDGDASTPGMIGTSFGNEYLKSPQRKQFKDINALYGALKFNFDNQYGQLEGIKQVRMAGCTYFIDNTAAAIPGRIYRTTPIFSGDTYLNRYTEKVIMPIFTDFLLGQPDQFPFNYLQRVNIPYPRYWMNTRKYDTTALADALFGLLNPQNLIGALLTGGGTLSSLWENALPGDLFYLDRGEGSCVQGALSMFSNKGANPMFAMRYGYMYTHCNGILDFYVESEVNLANRDWTDVPEGRHYDTFRYNNTDDLFQAEIIKKDNLYKYDYSLSASRFVTNLTSGGAIQPRDYDPLIAETCFTNYPKRLIYSLQAQEEAKKDYWRVFLANNYRDFKDKVNVIKPINKNGAVIFFPYQSPQMFQGVDTLQTDMGTKITIGDGGLFNQAFQNLVNSDMANEYGSCESQRGIINTPYGFFFISQAQGKIFQQQGQTLNPISNQGMKWWFNKYLPSSLVKQFPELEYHTLGDNPVVGVGCQVIYDINDDIVYFCKKDYKLKEEHIGSIEFDAEQGVFVTVDTPPDVATPSDVAEGKQPNTSSLIQQSAIKNEQKFATGDIIPDPDLDDPIIVDDNWMPQPITGIEITIGDPFYFDDCSWTVSYDPKVKAWISFHDWHPELCMPSINHFLTTKTLPTTTPQCPPGYSFNSETGMCENLLDVQNLATVTVDELPSQAVGGGCPPGYTFNPVTNTCENITVVPIICGGTIFNVVEGLDNPAYGQYGTKFYEDATLRPKPIEAIGSPQQLKDNGGAGNILNYSTLPAGTTPWDRLNQAGVWTTNSGGTHDPVGQWIGFVVCIEISETKTYSVGIAGDNKVRFGVDGDQYVVIDTPDVDNFRSWHVIPFELTAGTHIISLEGKNDGSVASFAAEVYDADITTLQAITTEAALSAVTVFTTKDLPGSGATFTLGDPNDPTTPSGCNCPDGFVLSPCGDELQCVSIDTVPAESGCSCPDGYTLVFPDYLGNYIESEGDCDKEPICRKVDCECPDPPIPGLFPTLTGMCDNLFLVNSPTYVNLNPLTCSYFQLEQIPPSYIVGGIWRHNYRCDLFANYYGTDYPWEIELIENSGQNVNTVRSIEYQLESYVYKGDMFNGCGDDRWHDLDFNFDEAILHNTEQVSGLLKLNLTPKEDPITGLSYPIINPNSIDILYSKVEQKYRFNQFFDITNDRGEFSNAEQEIFNTACNGYVRNLNELNLNYNKAVDQRKKFRHYYNSVVLRRVLSNDRKMLLKLVNSKLNLSFR